MYWLKGVCLAIGSTLLVSCTSSKKDEVQAPPQVSMSLSTNRISVTAANSDPAPTANLTITLSSAPTGTVYVGYQAAHNTINQLATSGSSATQSTVTVYFNTPSYVGLGTHTDVLTLGVYKDSALTQPIANSPQTVAVTYTVTADPSPTFASMSPDHTMVGGPGFSLTVVGTRFSAASVVQWNGSARPTVYHSDTQLTAQITAADIASAATVPVTISNGASGGGTSNALNFTVNAQAFSLLSIAPSSVPPGGPAFTLTVNGAQFAAASIVQWNGVSRPTTYVSASQLTAQISTADIASAGQAAVTVLNPLNATSNALPCFISTPDATAFQIDPGHSGAILFPAVTLPTAPLWTVTMDGPPSYPLIAQGKVFLTVPISGGSELVALDQTTGAVVWGPLMLGGRCNAAYDSGRILVAIDNFSASSMEAYDAATGNKLWSAVIPGQYSLGAMPSALNGKVYITESGVGTTLYCFDEANGALLWTQTSDAGSDGGAAVTATGVYVAGPQEAFAFDPLTGQLKWSNLLGGDGGGGALPVVAGNLAFMPDGFGTYNGQVLDAFSGALKGNYVADCPPAITPTTGYFLQQGTLRGIALANNQILWSFAGDGGLTTSPMAVNGFVFIGSSSGKLYGLNAATGSQVWVQDLGAAIPRGAGWGHGLPFSGMNAGDGLLIVPAGTTMTAFKLN